MKIRTGFVSNSSSASYIVTIRSKNECESIFNSLYSLIYWPFVEELQELIEDRIKRYEHLENSTRDIISGLDMNIYTNYAKNIKELKDILTQLKSINIHDRKNSKDLEALVKLCLNIHGIKYRKKSNKTIILEYFTIMHNNYTAGMPELLHEIIIAASFGEEGLEAICVKKD